MKWKSVFCLVVLGTVLVLCVHPKKYNEVKPSLVAIDGWHVVVEKGVTDTVNVKNWMPQAELGLRLTYQGDSACLQPHLAFYPIELEAFIEQKLMNYLVLRSTLFPPAPYTYRTDEHFVIGWNLTDYIDSTCCDCKRLEAELIRQLGLTRKTHPNEWQFWYCD